MEYSGPSSRLTILARILARRIHAGYQWSGEVEPGEVVVEMPLAKRVRTDHSDHCDRFR